jgi:GT2 family glycosyltransferase
MYDLSIVIPTCNRAELLRAGLNRICEDVRCSNEIIVVDGASDDGTSEVLEHFAKTLGQRMTIIRETRREGFVRAANKGFRAARGRNMIWLNDDARALPGTLDEAVRQIDAALCDVGFLAMFHRFAGERNIAFETTHDGKIFRLCHVRGTLYANFPIGRRETYEKLGYFDERFYFLGADPDLSLKAWNAGLRIEPAQRCYIDHDEHADERRAEDSARGREDNRKLFAKWDLPEKNPLRNDFEPACPCTLRGLRPESAKVSFLISTHNRKTALLNTLSQLRAIEAGDLAVQTIVIDNASTDGTAESVAREFPEVTLRRLEQNHGACAKNMGLAETDGQYVVFLDDDSFTDGASIRRMIEHFRREPHLGAAIFDVALPDGTRECSAFPNVFIGCGTGFRRDALVKAGGLPADFFMQAEEYDLSLRLLDGGWEIRRFDDLHVTHLKTPSARQPARTTRLDARNNLLVVMRRFPREYVWPYTADWMRRYRWMAAKKGWPHRVAFWRGVIEGIAKSLVPGRRREVSHGAFEKFAMLEEIHCRLAAAARERKIRSILLIDVGKNLYAFWLAAKKLDLKVVAIADSSLAKPGRKYRGIPILDDGAARQLEYDVAILTNLSPVHSVKRDLEWRATDGGRVVDLFESQTARAAAA